MTALVPATLMMRLFDCHDRVKSISTGDFNKTLQLIEGYIFRRSALGATTQSYWSIFAGLAYRMEESNPLESVSVGLARQRENYRFPSNEEFRREIEQRDLYQLRVCRYMLERMENAGQKEVTDTSDYSIEHILPQNENMRPEWKDMLGGDWKSIQETWVHRLGNLTLTAYNSTYSDRPFIEKQTIKGGFKQSAVRLNEQVRDLAKWTAVEIEARGNELANLATKIWPPLVVSAAAIEKAEQAELRKLSEKRDVAKVPMSSVARELFNALSPLVLELDSSVLELAEKNSVSYHGPGFFLEVLPRKRRLVLSLPLEYSEVDDPHGITNDATKKKFYFYANYEGGVAIRISEPHDIELAVPIIRQSLNLANA